MEKEQREGAEENLIKEGATLVESDEGAIFCLTIIGQIEGHYVLDNTQKTTKYDHVIPTLVALEESNKVDGIIILIKTLGGDVEAGLAMAEVIASMTKPTASVVLGGGHSIGVPLAVSADRSFIVPSAIFGVVSESPSLVEAPLLCAMYATVSAEAKIPSVIIMHLLARLFDMIIPHLKLIVYQVCKEICHAMRDRAIYG